MYCVYNSYTRVFKPEVKLSLTFDRCVNLILFWFTPKLTCCLLGGLWYAKPLKLVTKLDSRLFLSLQEGLRLKFLHWNPLAFSRRTCPPCIALHHHQMCLGWAFEPWIELNKWHIHWSKRKLDYQPRKVQCEPPSFRTSLFVFEAVFFYPLHKYLRYSLSQFRIPQWYKIIVQSITRWCTRYGRLV